MSHMQFYRATSPSDKIAGVTSVGLTVDMLTCQLTGTKIIDQNVHRQLHSLGCAAIWRIK